MPEVKPYNPLDTQPYVAPDLPTPSMPGDGTTPAPDSSGSPLGDKPGYDFTRPGAGNISHGGAIAGVADNILRGFMQGKAKGEAMKAMKMKRETDNMQSAYNLAAKNLLTLDQSGVNAQSKDPDQVKQYNDAKAAVDGSWNALMSFYGQHIQPQDTGKKSKAKKVEGGLASMFQSQDPAQVSQAWYQVMQKMGPPVYHQLQAANTPQNAQTKETAANQATAANTASKTAVVDAQQAQQEQQDRITLRTMESTRDAAATDPNVTFTKADQQRYYQLYDRLNPPKDAKEQWGRRVDRFSQLPEAERKTPENKAVWRALQAEGVELTGKDPQSKVPTSAFQARMEAFETANGRPPTLKEVDAMDKETHEVANQWRVVGQFLAAQRFDEQKQGRVNREQDVSDRALENANKNTQSEIDKVQKDVEAGHETEGSPSYNKRMAQIERNDYSSKLAIGKSFASRMRGMGIQIDAPQPEQWESSYLPKNEKDKIFGSATKEEKTAPKETKPSASGKAVSLKAAMALPRNKGKSAAEVTKDIEAHGHTVSE